MKYLNLKVSLAQDELILRATPEQVGIWYLLNSYCHAQMNGGVIQGCQDWTDEMWLRSVGVRGGLLAPESPLWHFKPMMLVVHHYDLAAEEAYRRKVKMGRVYIERRWAAHREKKIVQISSNGSGKPRKANPS